MAIFSSHVFDAKIQRHPDGRAHVGVDFSPWPLLQFGYNMYVEISTASIFRKPPMSTPLSSITVLAHFDTGASITSIDIGLATHLNLIATGQTQNNTASGPQIMPTFAIDIGFPNTRLMPFYNLRAGSCKLGFDLANNMKSNKPQNMGILIGRDIMSRWNIIWNGPTSTVIVSD